MVSWHTPYRIPGMSYAVRRMTHADTEQKFCELSPLFNILNSLGYRPTHVFPQTQYPKFAPSMLRRMHCCSTWTLVPHGTIDSICRKSPHTSITLSPNVRLFPITSCRARSRARAPFAGFSKLRPAGRMHRNFVICYSLFKRFTYTNMLSSTSIA